MFVLVEDSSLVIAHGDGMTPVKLPQGDQSQRFVLLDDTGNPALEIEEDGVSMVQGSEVADEMTGWKGNLLYGEQEVVGDGTP